jgi:hypothetical protein
MCFMSGRPVLAYDHFLRFYTGFCAPERPSRPGVPVTRWERRRGQIEEQAMAETATSGSASGAVTGGARILLQLEGLALFAAMIPLYAYRGGPWWLFALLFLAPDLSFAAYLAGGRIGAAVYNAVHTTIVPIALLIAGFAFDQAPMISIAVIWLAHIGIDRAFGYGLKYPDGFNLTHLGRIGKSA